jgi:hypothetical protein
MVPLLTRGAPVRLLTRAVLCALALPACQPDLGATSSQVGSLRVLAVSATPAEGAPGSSVSYAALLVDGTGERPDLAKDLDWAYCNLQKPLTELGDIAAGCFTFGTDFIAELGQGPTSSSMLPSQACSLFGPDVPPAQPMMPPGRPTDPDPTGGYYQPVRLILQSGGDLVLAAGESRVECGLPGATSDALAKFKMEYQPNTNPVLAGVSAVAGGEMPPGCIKWPCMLSLDDGKSPGLAVKAGDKVTLEASWPTCPGTAGCGAEPYAYYDPQAQAVTMRREAITVSWFATAGSFDSDRTGRAEDDMTTTSDNGWTAPSAPASGVLMWVVLRDDRGGVAWQRFRIDVG